LGFGAETLEVRAARATLSHAGPSGPYLSDAPAGNGWSGNYRQSRVESAMNGIGLLASP